MSVHVLVEWMGSHGVFQRIGKEGESTRGRKT